MSIIKDAFVDMKENLFGKKAAASLPPKFTDLTVEEEQAKINKIQEELDRMKKNLKAKVDEKVKEEVAKQEGQYKVEFLNEEDRLPEDKDHEPKPEEPLEITAEQQIRILEANLMGAINSLHERVAAIEQFIIKNFR